MRRGGSHRHSRRLVTSSPVTGRRFQSCVLLDVALPDQSGLDLQQRLAAERSEMPVIFITKCKDVRTSVQAMKTGAIEFLTKPFDNDVLVGAIRQALRRSASVRMQQAEIQALSDRYLSLTRREREVMTFVVSGLLNKQVGGELGISEITVKAHRGQVMRRCTRIRYPRWS